VWRLYLDESGDPGFDFDSKSPSKCLTIAILAVSQDDANKHIGIGVRRTISRKLNSKKRTHNELKGSQTDISVKRYFYKQVEPLRFGVYAITLWKPRVHEELTKNVISRAHLYNYLAQRVLQEIPLERADGRVELIVDKCKNKQQVLDFNEYLRAQLQGRLDPHTTLNIYHRDSCQDRGLSAVDLFAWGIRRKHELNDAEWFDVFSSKVRSDERYLFP
jgi:hypothetical protein